MWNNYRVYFELKYDTKPVCLWNYLLPTVHKSIYNKDIEQLVDMGVIEN